MADTVKDRIESLRRDINRHNHSYYVENSPTISDYDFDMLLKELEALEAEHPEYDDPLSPTRRVGSDLTKGFEQVAHIYPMLSLANTYSIGDVDAWMERATSALPGQKVTIVGEMKFDGSGISLIYEHGRLVRAVTRGDGTRGDVGHGPHQPPVLIVQGDGGAVVFHLADHCHLLARQELAHLRGPLVHLLDGVGVGQREHRTDVFHLLEGAVQVAAHPV